MIYESIFKNVVSSFGSLWNFKERGNTLEIITPFGTTSQKFISLFLTIKDGEYIISDGGWIEEGVYNNTFDREMDCFSKVFNHYVSSFLIKEVKSNAGITYFYKKTPTESTIPSLIFDMANFVSTTISLTNVEYADKEKETRERFRKSASDYILQAVPNKKIHFNEYLGTGKKKVKVSAIVQKDNGKLVLLNYITGSHYDYFRTNISKTNLIFELAEKTKEKPYIEKKIALIDNAATGYIPDQISIWLQHLISNTHAKPINWTKKEELLNI
ncbi:hypothetical protein [Ferruginibacter albus]|uniref:hypothetical protein n=1 Tax=Ferruginibacter albus TaxID=2875540 RepID=UPI001CC54952|nr:hypothetical protein [Ferruginibacter albus]UAY52703.1 hypothetical protein K9M53_03180 [Ferruginibacter albus]